MTEEKRVPETATTLQQAIDKSMAEQANQRHIENLEEKQDARWEAHEKVHDQEMVALQTALSVAERDRRTHDDTHDREHELHAEKHDAEQKAVKVALEAVAREREIHATAHEKEHIAHSKEHVAHGSEHNLHNLAITKAEKATDDRFASANAYREQINDLVRRMVTRDQLDALVKDHDRRYEEMRAAIIELEKGDVKGQGRSLGQSAVVALIVGGVGFAVTVLGLIIMVANLVTGSPTVVTTP